MIDFSKMEGHTPGPWWVKENANGSYGMHKVHIGEEHYFYICTIATDLDVHQGIQRGKDAHLIAAAPAMKDEILRLRKMLERLARQTAVICEMADAADDESQCFVVARAILNEIKECQ